MPTYKIVLPSGRITGYCGDTPVLAISHALSSANMKYTPHQMTHYKAILKNTGCLSIDGLLIYQTSPNSSSQPKVNRATEGEQYEKDSWPDLWRRAKNLMAGGFVLIVVLYFMNK